MPEIQIKTSSLGKETHAFLDFDKCTDHFIAVWMKNGEGHSLFLYNHSVVEYVHFTEVVMGMT